MYESQHPTDFLSAQLYANRWILLSVIELGGESGEIPRRRTAL